MYSIFVYDEFVFLTQEGSKLMQMNDKTDARSKNYS